MKSCRDCEWAVLDKALQLNQRACHGGPPQIVVVPIKMPTGQVGMAPQQMWPMVGVDDPICGQFRQKKDAMPWQTSLDNVPGVVAQSPMTISTTKGASSDS